MVYSKVEEFNKTQERIHEEFTNYLVQVKGLKAPNHVTESLERRAQIFIRETIDSSFSCVYDSQDIPFLKSAIKKMKENEEWSYYNKRHAGTIVNSLRHYVDFLDYKGAIKNEAVPISLPDNYREGKESYIHAVGYERNQEARKTCINHYGCKCAVCGFDFEKSYGAIGKDYIEVHHIVPIHERKGEYHVDPLKELIPLCSNCHSMIHRRNPVFSVEELRELLKC